MAAYGITFTKTGSDSVLQLVEALAGATAHRIKWFEISWANTATPADNVYSYVVRRVTSTATGTSLTPVSYDPADAPTPLTTAKHLITADASTFAAGAEVWREPLNARASFRWVANPGREFVSPATTTNGFGFGTGAASTSTFGGSVGIEEQ
jgi:hypothetical protein